MRPDAFVLAGGRSTRMGRDKALVTGPAGDRLVDGVARALSAVAGSVVVVRRGQPPVDGWPTVQDVAGPLHPLTGLATALEAARTPRVLVAPCDLVALAPEDVRALWDGAGDGVAVATDGDRDQPLFGVFRREDAAAARAAAEAGSSVHAFVAAWPRVVLPVRALVNANTPEDLDAAASTAAMTAPAFPHKRPDGASR